MSRVKSITSLQNEIEKLTKELAKLKDKEDAITSRLLALQKEKQEHEAKQLMDAFHKSGKTMQELMTFLEI